MKTEDEMMEKVKELALVSAKENDRQFGNPNKYQAATSACAVMCWALDLTQQEYEDILAVAILDVYREMPTHIYNYFPNGVPDRLRHLL